MKEYYHIHALKPDIFRITSAEGVFCDLFVGCDRALLFDTGYGFGNIREVVRGLTDKPLVTEMCIRDRIPMILKEWRRRQKILMQFF